jgi:hypothetical protein
MQITLSDKNRNNSRIYQPNTTHTSTWATGISGMINSTVSMKINTFRSTDLSIKHDKNKPNYAQLPSNSIINQSTILNSTKENTLLTHNKVTGEQRKYVDQSRRT